MSTTDFKHVEKRVYEIAGMLDGMLRVASSSKSFNDELDQDFLKNWLNKEKDPLIGTIIAQHLGLREPEQTGQPEAAGGTDGSDS